MLTEYEEQVIIFQFAEASKRKYPELFLLYSTLNGVKLTIGQAVKAKKSGLKKGVPDLVLPVPAGEFHGLYIELKREKGGVVSPEQRMWLDMLNGCGYKAMVCRGATEAIDAICDYLDSK